MPNYVTNRLEINADRETVQNLMDFLKGELNGLRCIALRYFIPNSPEVDASISRSFGIGIMLLKSI